MSDTKDGNEELNELCELAWGIIANAQGGDWNAASKDWKDAAERWRDRYHAMLSTRSKGDGK